MNLYLRLLWVIFKAWRSQRLSPLDQTCLNLRVLPNDLDSNRHMNNGRYLSLMDLGRIDLMTRGGLIKLAMKNRWMPIVGSAHMRYRRPLNLWQTYQLTTQIIGWDDKWFYIEHVFKRHNKVIAVGLIQGLLRGRKGNIPPQHIINELGHDLSSPELSSDIQLLTQFSRVN